jgi:hypothetical protein
MNPTFPSYISISSLWYQLPAMMARPSSIAITDANARLFEIVGRAERWLQTHTWKNALLKWNTAEWGEIPADFGRK